MKKILLSVLVFIFLLTGTVCAEEKDTVNVPILMYHSVADGIADTVISVENFTKHMEVIAQNGYNPVSLEDMVSFVDYGTPLPENPVCITFDDGYCDNYLNAFPVLREFGFKATIFVIGSSVGLSNYKKTYHSITPHFDYSHAKEMAESGLISVQSHTYDMHQWADFESAKNPRMNILRLPGESLAEYIRAFEGDFVTSKTLIESNVGNPVIGFAYPSGRYNAITDYILRKNGVRVTMATSNGANYIRKYDTSCLYNLNRYNMHNDVDELQLIKWLNEGGK